MKGKITYNVLEIHAKRIRELVESKKYQSPEDFVKTAVEILLTWESSHPEECMELMRSLMPFSAEQEAFMKQSMNPDELQRQFGPLEIDRERDELTQQKVLAATHDDHLRLRDGLGRTKEYIRGLGTPEPGGVIPYDGYPLLSGFYSRILPAKMALAVLAYLLERSGSDRVELRLLRVHAFDIAEEFAGILSKYENEHGVPRNRKMSTGLPKKGREDNDEEKMAMAQKRFKDQYVGKVRRNRITKNNHFEGALSALGLVRAFDDEGRTFVSLTELGREFFLIDNPVLEGEYESGPLAREESDFVMEKLIPQRELEKRFVDAAIGVVEGFDGGEHLGQSGAGLKMTRVLDEEIRGAAVTYLGKNPDARDRYNLGHPESDSEAEERRVAQWRLATMGRLSEMRIVNWNINEKGDSEYSLSRSGGS